MIITKSKDGLSQTFTMSQEEKDMASYLDFDDESLGKFMKSIALMYQDKHGMDSGSITNCAIMICTLMHKLNADNTKFTLEGVTYDNKLLGDYVFTVKKKNNKGS